MLSVRITAKKFSPPKEFLESLLKAIRKTAGYEGWAVGLHIAGDSYVKQLNTTYRGKPKATDILSFANLQLPSPEQFSSLVELTEEEKDLGDLIVSAPFVHRYCMAEGLQLEEHYKTLLTHGFVHLLGYDHESEEEYVAMHAREQSILTKLAGRRGSAEEEKPSLAPMR